MFIHDKLSTSKLSRPGSPRRSVPLLERWFGGSRNLSEACTRLSLCMRSDLSSHLLCLMRGRHVTLSWLLCASHLCTFSHFLYLMPSFWVHSCFRGILERGRCFLRGYTCLGWESFSLKASFHCSFAANAAVEIQRHSHF